MSAAQKNRAAGTEDPSSSPVACGVSPAAPEDGAARQKQCRVTCSRAAQAPVTMRVHTRDKEAQRLPSGAWLVLNKPPSLPGQLRDSLSQHPPGTCPWYWDELGISLWQSPGGAAPSLGPVHLGRPI